MFAFLPVNPLGLSTRHTLPSLSTTPRPQTHATPTMAQQSRAIPFMEAPPKLSPDIPGGVSLFDPLGFSNLISLDWLRESEIKHGRIAMLATVGFIFPELYHLPDYRFSAMNPLEAFLRVGFAPISQIVLFIMVCEAISYRKIFFEGVGEPGDYGFDPLGFTKDPKKAKYYRTAEIKNGR